MTAGRPCCRNAVTGITGDPRADNFGTGMIGECVEETCCCMTGYAVRISYRVSSGRDVGLSRCLTYGGNAIVTTCASTCNSRMIKAAAWPQIEKTGGNVAVVALGAGR